VFGDYAYECVPVSKGAPLAMQAHFEQVLVLTYALPERKLRPLLLCPPDEMHAAPNQPGSFSGGWQIFVYNWHFYASPLVLICSQWYC
jgi:hypothetical protein